MRGGTFGRIRFSDARLTRKVPKLSDRATVPQTDTGSQGEKPEARE